MSSTPEYVFLAGTPRSGGSVTLASLDGHPEVLAWPFEFLYFPFFAGIAGGRERVPGRELNGPVMSEVEAYLGKRLGHGGGIYETDRGTATGFTGVGAFDGDAFKAELSVGEEREFARGEYLDFLFEAFRRSHADYRERHVRYHLLLTAARGLDWADEQLLARSRVLFSYREPLESYASVREKALRKAPLAGMFKPSGKKSCLYWLETYWRICALAHARVEDPRFMVVALKHLQSDSAGILRSVCSFLDVEPHDELDSLTICGVPYGGNANEAGLNEGRIASRTSKPRTPLSSLERVAFESRGMYDFESNRERSVRSIGCLEALGHALSGACGELPADKLASLISRLTVLVGGYRTLRLAGRGCAAVRAIESGNAHLRHSPFWHSLERIETAESGQ